jgi:DNA topoisomerase-1
MNTNDYQGTSFPAPTDAPRDSARQAGLRYVHDDRPGYTRKRAGKGFVYYDTKGNRITEPEELQRFRSLVLPPAWENVWICPSPHGHIQATARDARGRKQYRYHPLWSAVRNRTKFNHMVVFGEKLPLIREHVNQQLSLRGMPRDKVLAVVVTLLGTTLIRIGNAEYSRSNGSYGLTTLLNKHVHVNGSTVEFSFRGKSGKKHVIDVHNRKLATIIRRCQELPGQELFGYIDEDGTAVDIDSNDVNEYLHTITGEDITAKDFRTWGGTLYALDTLCSNGSCTNESERKAALQQAVRTAAGRLGNTPAVCRKYYIHSAVISAFEQGSLLSEIERCTAEVQNRQEEGLSMQEQVLLHFLRQQANTSIAGME